MEAPKLPPDSLVHERYRVLRAIGQGGMGAVYEAVDERLGHRVALKQMLIEGEAADRAFEREARLLAALRHPALPAVSDFFTEHEGRFLVMQFIPGTSLADLARDPGGSLPVERVLQWAEELLGALEYLHGRQPPVLHRDIKPANLKLSDEGQIVLLDFGLAKGAREGTVTGPSIHGLTPQFAPLEQFQGSGTDPRSDLFSLAATIYRLLAGAGPVDAVSRASALATGLPDPLRPLAELNPAVPPRVERWIAAALALRPDDRPASAAAMRRELAEIRTSVPAESLPTLPWPATGRPDSPVTAAERPAAGAAHGPRPRSRWRLAAAGLAAAAVATLGLGVAAVAWLVNRDPAGATIRHVEGEGLEFRWPGTDLWTLSRGGERVALHSGSASRAVAPGRYRIEPNTDPVFAPVEFEVRAGSRTVVAPLAGNVDFRWPGSDLWVLWRGDRRVALASGSAIRFLAPGRYRIAPNTDAVFEPEEFEVRAGEKTLVAPPAGSFELRGPSKLWTLYRGDVTVALVPGGASRVVAAGRYRLGGSNRAQPPDAEFEVKAGAKTVVDLE